NSSVSENGESSSSILSKPVITFVKAADSPTVIKTNKDETVRKSSVKYAEMYIKNSKSSNVRGKSVLKMRVRLLVKGKKFVPTAVIINSRKVPVNAAKQISPRVATSTSTARYVNTAVNRPAVNGTKPSSNVFHKSHSPVRRTFTQRTTTKNSDLKETVNTVKVNNVTTAGTKAVVSAVQGNGENAVKSSTCWIWRPT
nr:hypothetical protein [Tanacetum cinerariifolium]